jgi:hypothetical protein
MQSTLAAQMREKDDRANSNRFRWRPDVAREAAVAVGVECLQHPLGSRLLTKNWARGIVGPFVIALLFLASGLDPLFPLAIQQRYYIGHFPQPIRDASAAIAGVQRSV